MPTGQPTYVILLAYMRSGSTFASLLFEENPRGFHWFEPIDAVYASIYGYLQGHSWPADILSDIDGNARYVKHRKQVSRNYN